MKRLVMKSKINIRNIMLLFSFVLSVCFFQFLWTEQVYAENVIAVGEHKNGVIDQNNLIDEYAFQAEDYTMSYRVSCDKSLESNLVVAIYDEAGNKLTSDWEPFDPAESERYVEAPKCKPGKYYIRVSASAAAPESVKYEIELSKVNNYGKIKVSKTTGVYTGKKQKLPTVRVYDCAGKELDQSEYECWFGRKYEYEQPGEDDCGYSSGTGKKLKTYATSMGEYTLYIYYNQKKGYYTPDEVDEDGYHSREYAAYVIRPEQAKIKSKSAKNGKITVSCKASRNAKWYVWELAQDKKFKRMVKTECWGTSKQVFQGLKKGKTYYVRVYIESEDYLKGAYSKPVKVKCK